MTKHAIYIVLILLCSCNTDYSKKEAVAIDKVTNIPNFDIVGQELPSIIDRQLKYTLIQKLAIDVNRDNSIDTILIEKINKWTNEGNIEYDWDDPGDFHRITIAVNGEEITTYANIDGWVNTSSLLKYDKNFDKESIIESDHIIIRNAGQGNILVFMAGYTYASSPGLLTIINIHKGVDTNLIFNKNIELYGLEDFNEDGVKDLITTVWDGYYQTAEENKKRHKIYLLNGGFTLSPEYSQKFCDQF